jgi:hypothetical protein
MAGFILWTLASFVTFATWTLVCASQNAAGVVYFCGMLLLATVLSMVTPN